MALPDITGLELRCLRAAAGHVEWQGDSASSDVSDAWESLKRKGLCIRDANMRDTDLDGAYPMVSPLGYAVLAKHHEINRESVACIHVRAAGRVMVNDTVLVGFQHFKSEMQRVLMTKYDEDETKRLWLHMGGVVHG